MIKVTVQDPYEGYPIKKIILDDLDIGMERSIWVSSKITYLDKNDNFIYEEISIINRLNGVITTSIYAGEKYNLVAYNETSSNKEKTISRTDHYILMNGRFVLMASDLDEDFEKLQGYRTNHLDRNGNLFYYRIVNFDLKSPKYDKEYDKDDNDLGDWHLHFMEHEDIYMTVFNVTWALEQDVIKKYRMND